MVKPAAVWIAIACLLAPMALRAHLDHERAKWGPIIQEANITLQ